MGVIVQIDSKRDRWRRDDLREHRRRIDAAIRSLDAVHEEIVALIDDMKSDGGLERPIEKLQIARWRAKQVEQHLEYAKARVVA